MFILFTFKCDAVAPVVWPLAQVVEDLLRRNFLLAAPFFQTHKFVVFWVWVLTHDVLLGGLGVFESDGVIVLLALETANPFFSVPLLRFGTKLQLVDRFPSWTLWCEGWKILLTFPLFFTHDC